MISEGVAIAAITSVTSMVVAIITNRQGAKRGRQLTSLEAKADGMANTREMLVRFKLELAQAKFDIAELKTHFLQCPLHVKNDVQTISLRLKSL